MTMQSLYHQKAIKSLKLVSSWMDITATSSFVLSFYALLRKHELVALGTNSLVLLTFAKISLWTKRVQTEYKSQLGIKEPCTAINGRSIIPTEILLLTQHLINQFYFFTCYAELE